MPGFLLRVPSTLNSLLDRALAKPGPAAVVIFAACDDPLAVKMADEFGRTRPDSSRLIVSWGPLEEKQFRGAPEFITLDRSCYWRSLWDLRRKLAARRVDRVVFSLSRAEAFGRRWAPAAITLGKLQAWNTDGESYRLEWRHPIASWRFLRGEPAADIFRPTRLAVFRKWPGRLRAAWLMGPWLRARFLSPLRGIEKLRPNAPGCAVICLPSRDSAQLDADVRGRSDSEIVLTYEPLVPDAALVAALRERLQQPGVWLACGRGSFKHVLGESWAPHRPHESGTFCLAATSTLFAFRREVFLELGGLGAFEQQLPAQGWAALSLRAWLHGYKTVYAGDIEFHGGIGPAPAGANAPHGLPLAPLVAACDEPLTAVRLLDRYSGSEEFRTVYLDAARWLRLPRSKGNKSARLMPLVEPGGAILEGRRGGRALRLAVVMPELPCPPFDSSAARVHHLLKRLAGECDLFLFCYAEKASESQVEALLETCVRLVLVQPVRETFPALLGNAPGGVARYSGAAAMQRHVEELLADWRIPIVQVESTRLAFAGRWLKRTPAASIIAAHGLRFARGQQARESPFHRRRSRFRSLNAAFDATVRDAASWRRYEISNLRRFDRVLSVSAVDQRRLARWIPPGKLRCVENGVDPQHFRSDDSDGGGEQLLFVGEFEHLVNILAFQILTQQIWPLIRSERPQAQLTVAAGEDYREHWRRNFRRGLAAAPEGVSIVGHVGDLRTMYARAAVVLVPLSAGNGASPRVLEALAMRRAVVASRAACEGLEVEAGQDLLIADDPAGFAAASVKLLADSELRRRLGEQGRSRVESRYDWSRAVKQQLEVYEELLRERKR